VRRPLIAGNWKMHKNLEEARQLVRGIREGLKQDAAADVLVAPPFTALATAVEEARGSAVAVGAQNAHFENKGAFTGEVSPTMLVELGCSHVILGHSERRQLFGETDEGVARKAVAALACGLVPIVCVGETLDEREAGQTSAVVERQLERALRELSPDQVAGSVVAYEPVWAIGTGRAATPEQAQEVHAGIRRRVSGSHGEAVAAALRLLYGGSVKPDNAEVLLGQSDIDGALVGGACLEAASFLAIIAAA
jgi:triosephosphate isomerase